VFGVIEHLGELALDVARGAHAPRLQLVLAQLERQGLRRRDQLLGLRERRGVRGYLGRSVRGYLGRSVRGYLGRSVRGYLGRSVRGY